MLWFQLYAVVFLLLFFYCWQKVRDPFHPWIVFIPQFLFIYAFYPSITYSLDPEKFLRFGGDDKLFDFQIFTFLLPVLLLWGASVGAKLPKGRKREWVDLSMLRVGRVYFLVLAIGVIGFAAWIDTIVVQGGFISAYGRAYGGGWSDSGYIRELPQIGILGALLVFFIRGRNHLRAADWLLIVFCVAPLLIHGLLGARRGPAFLALVVVGGGYVFFHRIRVSVLYVVPTAILVGTLMLFLVANRNDIYVGSKFTVAQSPLDVLKNWESNEYLIGSAMYRYTQERGSFYGLRELVHLTARIIPRSTWPTKYQDLSSWTGLNINFDNGGGVDTTAISLVSNWTPSVGSAGGYTAALWLEFQYVSPIVSFLIGWAYGRLWSTSYFRGESRLVYLLLVGFSVYLVMQDLDAWLFRVLLFALPLATLHGYVRHRPVKRHRPAKSQSPIQSRL